MLDLKIVCDTDKYMPIYANSTDVCMDLKVKIDVDENSNNQERVAFIMPNQTKVFRTGVQVGIPKGYAMFIFPRSSTGFKLNCMLVNHVGSNMTYFADTGNLFWCFELNHKYIVTLCKNYGYSLC